MSKPKRKTPAEALAEELWSSNYLRHTIMAELVTTYPWRFVITKRDGLLFVVAKKANHA